MGAYAGPDVSENGLVLALDAANPKGFDKYENLLSNTSTASAWASGTFTNETTYPILGLNTVRVTNLSSDGDSPNLSGSSISTGTYTVSHYIDTINSTSTSCIFYIFTFHAASGGFSFSNVNAVFTLSTKSFSGFNYSGPAWSSATTTVTNVGNGIYRVSITATTSLAGTSVRAYLQPSPADTSYAIIAGSQYESGSSPTDYYPTTGTAKNRGTTWTDLSGNGNTGTLVNGVGYSSANGGSLLFDGVNDYVDFFAPNLGTTTTVEMWCNIGAAYSAKMFFGWLTYDVWCAGGNLGYNTANSDVYGISSATVSSLGLVNNWKHYVFEMRSDVSYTNNKIYINTISQTLSQQQGTEFVGNRTFNSGNGRIAGWRTDLVYPMPMNCSSFKVYNRALTATEIQQNYIATKSRYGL